MNFLFKKNPKITTYLIVLSVCLIIVNGLFTINIVHAEKYGLTDTGLGTGTGDSGLLKPSSTNDIRTIIGSTIKYLLGFLGIIFLVLIIYAGYIWMMARGDEKEVEKAQGLIKTAVIGVIIILFSYVITNFVLSAIPSAVSEFDDTDASISGDGLPS